MPKWRVRITKWRLKVKGKGKVGFAPGGELPALPGALVERIRAGNYVDFTDLLPENIAEQFKEEKDKKKKPIPLESFTDWALSFTVFTAAIVSNEPGRAMDLFSYFGVITRLARDSGGMQWLDYDIHFREKAAALFGEVKWASLDQDLMQWARRAKLRHLSRTCDKWNSGRFCP